MRKNKNVSLISLVIFIAIVAVSYFIISNSLKVKEEENKKKIVKIGVVMPQTGFLASPGKNVIKGIKLYVDEFNNTHNDLNIELVIEDSKSDPKTGVTALNKLINIDKVKIVIGDLGSPIFLAMAPVAEKNKVILISPGASNPKVREAGDYIFRIYTSDEFDGKVMANYLIKDKQVDKCAVLFFTNDYGVGLKDAFIKEFKNNNGKIQLSESFSDKTLDFKNIIQKLKENNISNIYFIGSPKQDAYFLKQVKEMGYNCNLFGNLGFEDKEFISIAKGSFEKVIYSAPYFIATDTTNIKVVKFVSNFQKKYNEMPDLTSALGYDVANILGYVLVKVGFDVNKVKDELYKVKNFNGVTGNTSFDKKGDVIKDILIKKIDGSGNISVIKVYNINDGSK